MYLVCTRGGGISDQDLTTNGGLLELIESGDLVMADKGFDISYDLLIRGCRLNTPPLSKVDSPKVMVSKHALL